MAGPAKARLSHSGTRRGGFPPIARANSGSQILVGAGSSSTTL
jgi:hypothetical protein